MHLAKQRCKSGAAHTRADTPPTCLLVVTDKRTNAKTLDNHQHPARRKPSSEARGAPRRDCVRCVLRVDSGHMHTTTKCSTVKRDDDDFVSMNQAPTKGSLGKPANLYTGPRHGNQATTRAESQYAAQKKNARRDPAPVIKHPSTPNDSSSDIGTMLAARDQPSPELTLTHLAICRIPCYRQVF